MVKGKLYKVIVYESTLAFSHGEYKETQEVYIPQLGIAFNEKGYVFRVGQKEAKERYGPIEYWFGIPVKGAEFVGEIEISEEDAKKLKKFVELKEDVQNICRKYIPLT